MPQDFSQKEQKQQGMDNADNVGINQDDFATHQKNQRNQKLAIVVMSVIGLGILIFAFWQMQANLQVPLVRNEPGALSAEELAVLEEEQAKINPDKDFLRQSDTDEDGLNDFDELYVYLTSPYLADSDSDGINDFDEIKVGADPNCPKGQTCFAGVVETEIMAVDEDQLLNISAEQLRALLIQSGQITEAQLAQLSDEELLKTYQEFVKNNPEMFENIQVELPVAEQPQSMDDLKNISAAEVRQILRDQGFSDEELNQVDDATLIQLYQDALDKLQTE